ncbi:MAG: hypothetical protein QOJ43_32, partial [Gaiellaceae bacterium]|nr:hypothetical protein [Gaiellaceae bacterium]
LHAFLVRLRADVPGNIGTRTVREALASIGGLEDPHDAQVIQLLAVALDAPRAVRHALEQAELPEKEDLLAPLFEVEIAFQNLTTLGGPLIQVTSQISDATIAHLNVMAVLLRSLDIKDQRIEELERVAEMLRELRDDLEGADLDGPLKSFLLLHIDRMLRGCEVAPFFGPEVFRNAVMRAVGETWLNEDVRRNEGKRSVRKFLAALALVLTTASTTLTLGTQVVALLSGSEPAFLLPPAPSEPRQPGSPPEPQ